MNVFYQFINFFLKVWTSWGLWSSCSKSCGTGQRTRDRRCVGLGHCTGPSRNLSKCSIGICPSKQSKSIFLKGIFQT